MLVCPQLYDSRVPKTARLDVDDGLHVAVQRWGSGAADLVLVPGIVSHVELQWADAAYARYLASLGRFARVTAYDKRGGGCSDPVDRAPTLEEHVRDLGHVVDSTGQDRVVLLGFSNGGAIAMAYAAAHPERVLALVLCSSFARVEGFYDLVETFDAEYANVVARWGEGYGLDLAAPSLSGSKLARRNYALFERAALHPRMIRDMADELRRWDVTPILGQIQAPTMVLHRRGDRSVPFEASRELARRIPGAAFVELAGGDHVPYLGDSTAVLRPIEAFVREVADDPAPSPPWLTVLFTDLVGSTGALADAGDARWRDLREAHDSLCRAEVAGHGGRSVKSTGDGWLAVFDEAPDGVRAASAILEQVKRIGLEVRAGAHAGPVDVLDDGDLSGMTVNVAARVAALAGPSELLVTDAVRGRLATAAELLPWGLADLKGVPGTWTLHRLASEPDELPALRHDDSLRPVLRGSAQIVASIGRKVLAPARARLAGATADR